jgi:uncharacterized protein (DUF427 family)
MSQEFCPESPRAVPGPMDTSQGRRYMLEASPRRVRVMYAGECVADSVCMQLLFETGKLPVYYFPSNDVCQERLSVSGREDADEVKGPTTYFDLALGGRLASNAAWRCAGRAGSGPDLSDLIAFDWNAMDAWFEEDEQVFVHARDPYHRVDALESGRHIQVSIGGVAIADSRRPVMVFETGLPTRYYLPKMDVRLDLLQASDAHSACPYKGTADYFHVRSGEHLVEDIAWCYETPIPEMPKIAGRLCFYDEKVDVTVNGEPQARPRTKWS